MTTLKRSLLTIAEKIECAASVLAMQEHGNYGDSLPKYEFLSVDIEVDLVNCHRNSKHNPEIFHTPNKVGTGAHPT